MKLLFRYLHQRRRDIAVYLLLTAIFMALFLLYRLPPAAALYPLVLSLLLGSVYLGADFLRVRRNHKLLSSVTDLTAAQIAALPQPGTIAESDYQALIAMLLAETARLQADADARYRDMSEYYTVWAHQIKTPIAAQRLKLQSEDSPLSRTLSSDLFRIEQYVDMVLAFVRLDSPASDYVFRLCSLDEIIRQAVRKFAAEFIGRKIRLEYEPVALDLITDDKWLSLVLEQIISNALKYTPSGSIRIYLECPDTLCIADTGIGIAPEDLPRIFEKGYTGCNGRADKKASGIGLYLCRRILHNLGFGITAKSAPGIGTTIRIYLHQEHIKP